MTRCGGMRSDRGSRSDRRGSPKCRPNRRHVCNPGEVRASGLRKSLPGTHNGYDANARAGARFALKASVRAEMEDAKE